MEEQVDILAKYLKLYDEKNYKDIFYTISYSEIIQHLIDYKIYDYDEQYGNLPNQDEILDRYKKEIIVIDDIETKKKVFPLILFIGEEFYQELYENDFFNDLKEFLLKELKEINFDIDLKTLNKDSYQFENQSNLKQEIKEFNYDTILEFGFSEPTMGTNQYVRFIYFIAEKIFFKEYCEILNNKDSFNFLYLTNSLEWDYNATDTRDKKRRIKLLEYITGKNKLILEIRFLRDLLWYEYDKTLVKEIVLDLSKDINIWKSFSNYYLNSPSQYKKLFHPLGELISDLEEKKIDILIYAIKINNYNQDENTKIIFEMFQKINDDKKQKYIAEKIYNIWIEYIESYQDYFGSIILTDVINIVIYYIQNYLEKDFIISELNKSIYTINETNNKWFQNIIEQNNYFYKQMSKIFIYSFALDKYKLYDLKEKIVIICKNNKILKKEQVYQAKTTLQLFEEHII